jgi:hypothetical protein
MTGGPHRTASIAERRSHVNTTEASPATNRIASIQLLGVVSLVAAA